MDARKPDEDGLQVQGSWIPTTPVKPHLPRPTPIYTDGQGNQIERATWLGSETFSSFTEGSQTGRLVACCNSPNCSEFNRASINNWNEETCEEESHMGRWNYVPFGPFGHLLALADAAKAASGTVAHLQNDDVATSSLMRATSCQNECNGEDYPWSNFNCMPKEPHCKCVANFAFSIGSVLSSLWQPFHTQSTGEMSIIGSTLQKINILEN